MADDWSAGDSGYGEYEQGGGGQYENAGADPFAGVSGPTEAELAAFQAALDAMNAGLQPGSSPDFFAQPASPAQLAQLQNDLNGMSRESWGQTGSNVLHGVQTPATDRNLLMGALTALNPLGAFITLGDRAADWARAHGIDVHPSSFNNPEGPPETGGGQPPALQPGFGGGVSPQMIGPGIGGNTSGEPVSFIDYPNTGVDFWAARPYQRLRAA